MNPPVIPADQAERGTWVTFGGQRCQIISVTPARLQLRRPGGIRASARRPATVTLEADQGTCADCALRLVHGEAEEARHPRSVGYDTKLRYFCPAAADGRHHPQMENHL